MINEVLSSVESSFMDSMQAEYKELAENNIEIFKYADFKIGFKILSDATIAFRNPLKMNDPNDCSLKLLDYSKPPNDFVDKLVSKQNPDSNREQRRKIAIKIKKLPRKLLLNTIDDIIQNDLKMRGVTCFSKKYDNLLMWSRYGNSHEGISIGFNLKQLYYYIKTVHYYDMFFIKAKYEVEFEVMDYFKNKNQAIINWLRTKSIDWEYEEEVRIVLSNLKFNSDGLYILPIDKNCIKNVYLGSRILPENESCIRELLAEQYPEVIIKKLKLNASKFEVINE